MKIIKLFVVFLLSCSLLEAKAFLFFDNISKTINQMDLQEQSIISVSVKNEDGKDIYKKNENKLLNPASSLKVFTFAPSLATLGKDYKFATQIYKDTKNNLYIKLGADPLLKTVDLRTLVILAKKNYNFSKVNKIFIDDTIIDKVSYPSGWMVDDYFPNMPIISPYTLNQNQTSVTIYIPSDKSSVNILQSNPYKHSFINKINIGETNCADVSKNNGEYSDILVIDGIVAKDFDMNIAVLNPKYHFIANLNEIFEKEKINYKEEFYFAKTPKNVRKIAEVSHTIDDVAINILKFSDNFASEILFKVAGAKFKNKASLGSTKDGIDMFNHFYKSLGIDVSEIKIYDASGVSRYNLLYTDWMNNSLNAINKNMPIKNYLMQPNEGTLNKRLRHMRGKLWAKTGTLNGVSSLCGYIKTRRNKDLTFSIIISNFNKKPSIIKGFEDSLIDAIWEL